MASFNAGARGRTHSGTWKDPFEMWEDLAQVVTVGGLAFEELVSELFSDALAAVEEDDCSFVRSGR